jgi:two-component system, NarL family, response regulator NreC
MQNIRVIVLEHSPISQLIKQVAGECVGHVEVIASTTDISEVLALIRSQRPDVIFVELTEDNTDALWPLDAIQIVNPNIPILVYIHNFKKDIILQLVKAGANGIICTVSDRVEIITAIQTLRNGYPYMPNNVVKQLISDLQRRVARQIK